MKKILIIILFIIVLNSSACGVNTIEPLSRTGFNLGTIVTIKIYGGNGEDSLDRIFGEIERLESILSKHIEGSDIDRINAAAGIVSVELQPETVVVLAESIRYYELSKGYFDITVGPLVRLWGIGTDEAAVPSDSDLKTALAMVNIDELNFYNNTAGLSSAGMSIDTGGISKGYIADKVAEIVKDEECSGAVINLGGNVLTVGEKPDGSRWKIGIQNPFKATGEYMSVAEVEEMSVVTSGPYERNFEENGIVYHHILDPFTGYPVVNDIAGITIISEKSIDGDGLSTSVFAMGADAGLELIESIENTECYIVLNDGALIMSSGFSKYIVLN